MTRPRVVDLVRDRVVLESGRPPSADWTPERAAVVAHWSRQPQVSKSARTLVAELRDAGYEVVVVSTAPVDEPLRWDGGPAPDGVSVLRRPNTGYDFGSWAVGLDQYPGLARSRHVVVANDSMLGPFASIGWLIEAYEKSLADVWGITDTDQFERHLQSYFLGFQDGVLADPPLRRFWADVRVERDKTQIIQRNEIGLSRLLAREGYVSTAAFPSHTLVKRGDNPVIRGWRSLVDAGLPMVKRELLRDPTVVPDGKAVPLLVRRRFGQDVEEWL